MDLPGPPSRRVRQFGSALNGLDLFSGCAGLTVALSPWVKPIAYCEIDQAARAVLLARMASGDITNAPIWDDVRTLRGGTLPPPVDIIYGGFPCQDLSLAGARVGLEGKRSGLFYEVVRLVSEIRPALVFLENVPGIRQHAHRVLGALANLGYDARWMHLAASEVGAPHQRNRWWLLAHANGIAKRPAEKWQSWRGYSSIAWNDGINRVLGHANSQGESQPKGRVSHERGWAFDSSWWGSEPSVGRVADGVSDRVAHLAILGNSVVPQAARHAFAALAGISPCA